MTTETLLTRQPCLRAHLAKGFLALSYTTTRDVTRNFRENLPGNCKFPSLKTTVNYSC